MNARDGYVLRLQTLYAQPLFSSCLVSFICHLICLNAWCVFVPRHPDATIMPLMNSDGISNPEKKLQVLFTKVHNVPS